MPYLLGDGLREMIILPKKRNMAAHTRQHVILFVKVVLFLLYLCYVPSFVTSKPVRTPDTGAHRDESRLPINVRNNGGEVFREVIRSNVNDNWIGIEFRETDGSLVKQIIDFRNVSPH